MDSDAEDERQLQAAVKAARKAREDEREAQEAGREAQRRAVREEERIQALEGRRQRRRLLTPASEAEGGAASSAGLLGASLAPMAVEAVGAGAGEGEPVLPGSAETVPPMVMEAVSAGPGDGVPVAELLGAVEFVPMAIEAVRAKAGIDTCR